MVIKWIRAYCISLPHSTEGLQWGEALVFKVSEKIFAILNLDETVPNRLSLKCTVEEAAELVEVEGIIPAPYLARNHWICFQDMEAVRRAEMRRLIRQSYDLVIAKLPKKKRAELSEAG